MEVQYQGLQTLSSDIVFILVGNAAHVCGRTDWDLDQLAKQERTRVNAIHLRETLKFMKSSFPVSILGSLKLRYHHITKLNIASKIVRKPNLSTGSIMILLTCW